MAVSHELSFAIISLGCSKNQSDSEHLNGDMLAAGFKQAVDVDNADIIIVNTCGFISSAKEESIEEIFNAINLKEYGTQYVAAVGCLTQRYQKEVAQEIPELNLVYGLVDRNLVTILAERCNVSIKGYRDKIHHIPLVEGIPYHNLKIAEGCSNNCSFCAIPLIRGGNIPFSLDRIVEEAEYYAGRGVVELNIVAQDTTLWHNKNYSLRQLLEHLSRIDGIQWMRLLYSHPDHMTDEIIDSFTSVPKLLPYVDMPFQHVDKNILAAMNRRGSYEKYLNLVVKMRERIPGLIIRSTLMTGFPGEGEEEFEQLLDFVEEAELDKVGVFTYSREEGTGAALLDNEVPLDKAEERKERLMALQQNISYNRLQSRIGTVTDVLVESVNGDGTALGRAWSDAPEVDGFFFLTGDQLEINTIVPARITGSTEYDLMGEVV